MKQTCFIIVTLIVLKSILHMTESFVCEPPSVYHNHTRTCVRLVQEKRAFFGARSFCEDSFKGNLMFIYDSETSSFIKEKLRVWNIQEALIGLQNAASFEQYRWDDNTQQPPSVTYFDWATPLYVEDKTKRAVVATAEGWRKHDFFTPADFICQSATATPQTPVCQHTSNTTHVLVTCSSYKVYPEARCVWEATFGIDRIKVLPESTQHMKYILNESVYYNTTCAVGFRPDVTGVFKIVIKMYPKVLHSKQAVTQDNIITIGPPDCPSQFNVKLINKDSVIISWTPGHNGGLTQTFVFYSHTNTSLERTLVATVVDDNTKSMVYIVRNLHMNTSLVFSVQVRNMLSITECPDLNVRVTALDLRNNDLESDVSDTNLLYYIIPPCLVVLIVIVTAVAVRKGCRAYGRKRQHKTESNLNTTSLNLPLDEDGYLLVLGTSVGSPPIEHIYRNVQPAVGSDVEHESVGNVRVDNTRIREHALESSTSENPYNVIQETDEARGQVSSNEETNPSTRQETDQTRTVGNLSTQPRLSNLTNVYDKLDEKSYNDYLDVYNVPD